MIKGVLLDLSGTLHIGDTPLPGAVDALRRLRSAAIPLRFVTNTSRKTRKTLHQDLSNMGFHIEEEEIFSGPLAVRRYLQEHGLRPYLLVHPNLLPEFDGLDCDDPNAVVVGDAEDDFSYAKMNQAFRLLKQGAQLLATGRTRYFQGADGLDLDAGPYVAALEFAAETTALVLGKPSRQFFHEAAEELKLRASECIMVGDDVESDVAGALDAGLKAMMVQTGKYREGDEGRIPYAIRVVKDIAAAADEIVQRFSRG